MSVFRLNTFGGIAPKIAPRLLPDTAAQVAENVWLNDGDLQPINVPLFEAALTDAVQKTIFKWRRNNTTEWLSWTDDTDVVIGPIADDDYDRIYYASGGTLGMKLYDGGTVTHADIKTSQPTKLIPAPTGYNYPTITLKVGGSACATVQQDNWVNDYTQLKCTFDSTGKSGALTVDVTDAGGTSTIASFSVDSVKLYDSAQDKTDGKYYGTLTVENVDYEQQYVSGTGYVSYVGITFDFGFVRTSTDYRIYVVSHVDKYGQESVVSDPSDEVEVKPNQKVVIDTGTPPSGEWYYIYRSAQGTDSADFFFVAQIGGTITDEDGDEEAGETSPYSDKFSDGELQDVMPLIENPPVNIKGLVNMPGGWIAGFYGKEVYFSEPYLPYSWPTKYRQTMFDEVVALGVSGNDLVVLTKGKAVYISGSHPETLTATEVQITGQMFVPSCLSKRSVASLGGLVCYSCPDGLAGIQGGVGRLLTVNHYNPEDWALLAPTTMIGAIYEDRYFGFCTATTLIVQLGAEGMQITTTTQLATGVFSDLEDDSLYMIQAAEITLWAGGATPMTMKWRTKELKLGFPQDWAAARILSSGYTNMTLSTFFETAGVLTAGKTATVLNESAFRLAKSVPYHVWCFEIQAVDRIHEFTIAQSMEAFRK